LTAAARRPGRGRNDSGRSWQALTFGRGTKPIDTRELEAAIKLAAARHAEFEALEAEVGKAQQALEDRKLVERAKGLLMSALKLSEQDAFRRLQTTARERNLRLADVARRIVEQQSLLEPKPDSPSPSQ
jgi:AmiR/NasT family two-component response regulator